MRRVVSIWLPTWPTDRLRRRPDLISGDALPREIPLVTTVSESGSRLVAALDAAASALGLHVSMKLAQAQAMVPGLHIVPADPAGDAAALLRIAAWCLRYAPLTAADTPDGVWIDLTGAAHLHGGEAAMLDDVLGRLRADGFAARGAIADTPGAASALARYGNRVSWVLPPGEGPRVLPGLPVAALRLSDTVLADLRRLGFDHIGQLESAPRAPLARRFGATLLTRLDQAFGRSFEPIEPMQPPATRACRAAFAEPISTAEAFSAVMAQLTAELCEILEQAGLGALRLDLRFERVDGSAQTIAIGTARPSRQATHLARLLDERLEQIDPGAGVEVMWLAASLTDPLSPCQSNLGQSNLDQESTEADLATLVDRLGNRLGVDRVYRLTPVESDVPERSVRAVAPLAPPCGATWTADLPRPVRLFRPPQPIEAMALLPDHPPSAFTWRRVRHRVRHADGPERIYGEWEKRDREMWSVRDYFRVEDETGRRFWLYRSGDGTDPSTGDLRWFLHGMF